MFDDLLIVVFMLVLAALVGAGLGSYLAMKPVAERVLHQAEELSAKAQSVMETVEQKIEQGIEELDNLKIEVPEPRVTMSVNAAPSPWSALLLALGFVGGMALLNMRRVQRLVAKADRGLDIAIERARALLARRKGKDHGCNTKKKSKQR